MVTRPDSQGQPRMIEASRNMAKLNGHGCTMAAAHWLTTLTTPGAGKVCACKLCGRSVLGTMGRPVGVYVLAGSWPSPGRILAESWPGLGRERAASPCDHLYSAAAVAAAGRACHRLAESAK